MRLSLKHSVCLFFLLCGFLLSFPIDAFAKDQPDARPYKATTVDECIQEKECFWHHLLLAVQVLPNEREPTKHINIKKWGQPVLHRHVNFIDTLNSEASVKIIRQLLPYFRKKFSDSKQYNFLVFVTDDISATLSGKMKETFNAIFGEGSVSRLYEKDGSPNCFYLYVQDKEQQRDLVAYFAFVQKDHPDILSCYKEVIYAGLGLADISYSPIIQSESTSDTFTKLEQILLLYLYQDFIESGMSYEKFKAYFDKGYEPFINFLKQEGTMDE